MGVSEGLCSPPRLGAARPMGEQEMPRRHAAARGARGSTVALPPDHGDAAPGYAPMCLSLDARRRDAQLIRGHRTYVVIRRARHALQTLCPPGILQGRAMTRTTAQV